MFFPTPSKNLLGCRLIDKQRLDDILSVRLQQSGNLLILGQEIPELLTVSIQTLLLRDTEGTPQLPGDDLRRIIDHPAPRLRRPLNDFASYLARGARDTGLRLRHSKQHRGRQYERTAAGSENNRQQTRGTEGR